MILQIKLTIKTKDKILTLRKTPLRKSLKKKLLNRMKVHIAVVTNYFDIILNSFS